MTTGPDPAAERAAADRRLAVYGTLRPGECNHGLLAGIAGRWQTVTLHGHLRQGEFPEFWPDPAGSAIAAWLLEADELPLHWPRLDAFEGPGYRRVCVPVSLTDGRSLLANVYVCSRALA